MVMTPLKRASATRAMSPFSGEAATTMWTIEASWVMIPCRSQASPSGAYPSPLPQRWSTFCWTATPGLGQIVALVLTIRDLAVQNGIRSPDLFKSIANSVALPCGGLAGRVYNSGEFPGANDSKFFIITRRVGMEIRVVGGVPSTMLSALSECKSLTKSSQVLT